MRGQRGLTAVELIIIMAIIAILIYAAINLFKPIELFRESRDTQRLADMSTLSKALSYHLANTPNAKLGNAENFVCGSNFGSSSKTAKKRPFRAKNLVQAGLSKTDGSGWVAANLKASNIGPYASLLPKDPLNNNSFFYAFACDKTSKSFELNANLESKRFSKGGFEDKETSDGGDNPDWYEIGNTQELNL